MLDADVHVEFTKGGPPIQVRATHDQAQNKLLYAASVHLDDPGEWHFTVSVRAVTVAGVLAVAPRQPKLAAYWSYLALPFLWMAIFAIHQWLRREKQLRPVAGSL